MTRGRLAIAAALWLAGTWPAQADVIERRGAEPPLIGSVIAVDDDGVRLRDRSGLLRVISWDRVRDVQVTPAPPDLESRLEMATDLWRARTRLERRDAALAEPLLVRWFETSRGCTSETALVVAEGLLRCRLARGAHEDAVVAALEVARLRRAGETTDSYALLEPVLDETTSLCPALPPIWVQPQALARLERDLARYDSRGDEVVAALASLYHRAALRQLGRGPGEPLPSPPDHPGVELLARMEAAWAAEPSARGLARARLIEPAADAPAWVEAWGRLAAGLSLLGETDAPDQEAGLVALAHVAARFGSTHAYLAGIALAWMAAELESMGQGDAAAALRAELARRYPRHPIREHDHLVRGERLAHARKENL